MHATAGLDIPVMQRNPILSTGTSGSDTRRRRGPPVFFSIDVKRVVGGVGNLISVLKVDETIIYLY